MESGHSRAVEHHGGEVPEHGALDVVAQEHGLPVDHLYQRGVGCLLLDIGKSQKDVGRRRRAAMPRGNTNGMSATRANSTVPPQCLNKQVA